MNETTSDILQLYQNGGGSSGRGNSFYSTAALCGRKQQLDDQNRSLTSSSEPKSKDDYFAVGAAYHLFHQLQVPSDMVFDMTDTRLDEAFFEGLRLFRGWQELWGSAVKKYGKLLQAELPVEAPEGMFADKFTGRLDAVVEITPEATIHQHINHLECGIYIVDWKTAKGPNSGDALKFMDGTQAKGYLTMYPEAKGIIFDVLYKHQQFRHEPKLAANTGKIIAGKSYDHYLAQRQLDDTRSIQSLVAIGSQNYTNNTANPAACFNGNIVCKYKLNGTCPGY